MNKIIPSIKVPIIQKGIVSKVILSDEFKGKKIIMFTISFSESNSDNKSPSGKLSEKKALKGIPNRSYFSKKIFIF